MSRQFMTCPECDATLRSSRPDRAGKKVRCPHCKAVFTADVPVEPPEPDEEEAPRPRRKERPRERPAPVPMWVIGACIGGALFLLLIGGGGLALAIYAAMSDPREKIIGTWQSTDQPSIGSIEFRRDGTLTARLASGVSVSVTYRFLDDKTIEVEVPNPAKAAQEALFQRMPHARNMPQAAIPDTVKGTVTIVKLTRTELVTYSTSEGRKHFRRSD